MQPAELLASLEPRLRALACHLARRMGVDWAWRDDLLQCGRIAVWRGHLRHTPDRGPAEAFLMACAKNAMYTEFRRAWGQTPRRRKNSRPLPLPDGFDLSATPPPCALWEYTEGLSADDAAFVEARFARDEILSTLGAARGKSKGWAYLEERRILTKLRGGSGR